MKITETNCIIDEKTIDSKTRYYVIVLTESTHKFHTGFNSLEGALNTRDDLIGIDNLEVYLEPAQEEPRYYRVEIKYDTTILRSEKLNLATAVYLRDLVK